VKDTIAFPYITHQKPAIDPHLPSSNAMADKLDDVLFDGLSILLRLRAESHSKTAGRIRRHHDSNIVTIASTVEGFGRIHIRPLSTARK